MIHFGLLLWFINPLPTYSYAQPPCQHSPSQTLNVQYGINTKFWQGLGKGRKQLSPPNFPPKPTQDFPCPHLDVASHFHALTHHAWYHCLTSLHCMSRKTWEKCNWLTLHPTPHFCLSYPLPPPIVRLAIKGLLGCMPQKFLFFSNSEGLVCAWKEFPFLA